MDSSFPSLLHFYDEPIEVTFDVPPTFEKSPPCPLSFTWHEQTFPVKELLAEWHDFRRRGRMGQNMRPAHAAVAAERGSLGVGRFYFRVRVPGGQVFDIYYDRAPKSVEDRKGHWFIFGERRPL